jgi:hypothetical protein
VAAADSLPRRAFREFRRFTNLEFYKSHEAGSRGCNVPISLVEPYISLGLSLTLLDTSFMFSYWLKITLCTIHLVLQNNWAMTSSSTQKSSQPPSRTGLAAGWHKTCSFLLTKCPKVLRATGNYIKEHPVSFTLQAVGVLAMTASVVAVPVLGAAGFAATGPVAGSAAAAAWQSSIGLVEAGSLFAWCQSAAMSGAALNGIFSFGVAGAGVARVATVPVIPGFAEKFKSVFRRG